MISLPLFPPQPDFLRPHFRPRSTSPPRSNGTEQAPHQRQHANRPTSSHKTPSPRSPLALLAADEAAIAARKTAIRNFGASWIRPPGVAKTLQAQREEELEAAEQEEAARQEQGMRDLQARQEVEEARGRAAAAGEDEQGQEQIEERDLDDEIPDADALVDGGEANMTFNEESLVEGSRDVLGAEGGMGENQEQFAQLEEAELTGAARDEEDLGIEYERDLDDSVPEAGSYQHTDTELEDSSSDDDDSQLQDSFAAQSARRATRQQQQVQTPATRAGLQGGLQERLRADLMRGQVTGGTGDALTRSPGSLNLSSSLLESSFVGSSPVMQRGRGGARGRRGRLS